MKKLPDKLQGFLSKLFDAKWHKKNIILLIILSSALSISMFGENVNARWWVIDDHEIAYFLGSDHTLTLGEIPEKLLNDTEISLYPYSPRFRPVYYIFRLLETWVWGDKPGFWYAFRVLIFAFFVGLFWYLVSQKVGSVIGGFTTFYMASQTYWVDIFGRLGPSECYAAIGLAILGWGVYEIYKSNKTIGWWNLLIGTVVCSGTKENFLFLLLPVAYISWDIFKSGGVNFIKAALAICSCAWMAWIGSVVFISARFYGRDVYSNSVGIRDRLYTLAEVFGRVDVLVLLSICVGLMLLHRSIRMKTLALSNISKNTLAIVIISTFIYISQIFIYDGDWPVGTRYNFPGVLTGPLLLVVLISLFHKLSFKNTHVQIYIGLTLLGVFGAFLLACFQLYNIAWIRSVSKQNVEKTVAFSREMERLAKTGIQNSEHVLIIQADNPVKDYESIFSYSRFLRFYSAENQISFLWAGPKPETYNNAYRASLASDLRDLSFYGKLPLMSAGNEYDFTPYSDVDGSDTECILILLSGQPKKNCMITITGSWP